MSWQECRTLSASVGSFEVAAGRVGLGLVSASGAGLPVLLDCLVALMEEVEHLSGIELGAATEPIGAFGLGCGFEIILRGFGDLVLASLRVGQAEIGHLETGVDEVVGLAGVFEDSLVGCDCSRAIAFVFGQVGFFEAEEIVVGILLGQATLNGEGFWIAGIVAQEERERSSRLNVGDDSMGGGFAEEVEPLLLVAGDAGDADHDAEDAGQAGDSELLNADGHLGVGIVRIDFEDLLTVAARGVALFGRGDKAVINECDEGGVHAAGVSSGKQGVLVVGVGFDELIGHGDGGVGELLDTVTRGLRDRNASFGCEEGIVGVVGGVEEVLMVELAEDEDHEDVAAGHGVLRIGPLDGLETREGTFVVEVVEVLVGVANLRGEVDGVGVGCGVV